MQLLKSGRECWALLLRPRKRKLKPHQPGFIRYDFAGLTITRREREWSTDLVVALQTT